MAMNHIMLLGKADQKVVKLYFGKQYKKWKITL